MTAIEAYRAYGGKRTNVITLEISVNGERCHSAYRRLGALSVTGAPNTVYFQKRSGGWLAIPDNDKVTLSE